MSEDEYMTGEELRNTYAKATGAAPYSSLTENLQKYWDMFADILKVPRPPKLKTLLQVFDEWDENRQLTCGEGTVESLRVALNAAREALDSYL